MRYLCSLLFLILYGINSSAQTIVVPVNKGNQDSIFENIPVFRLQVRVTTDPGRDLGSDKGIWIKFCYADEGFYLAKGIDNFQEGHTDLYDILSFNIKKIKDIQFIRLGQIAGAQDYWGLKQIELLINGNANPVFTKRYTNALQINNSLGMGGDFGIKGGRSEAPFYSIATYGDLRNSTGWKLTDRNKNMKIAPLILTAEYLKSVAEAGMGDYISKNKSDFAWSSRHYNRAVDISYISPMAIRFNFMLEANVYGFTNPVLAVSYIMIFECKDQRLLISVTQASVSQDNTPFKGILPDGIAAIIDYLGKGLRKAFEMASLVTQMDKISPINLMLNKLYFTSTNVGVPGIQTNISDCNTLKVLPDASVQLKSAVINTMPVQVIRNSNN